MGETIKLNKTDLVKLIYESVSRIIKENSTNEDKIYYFYSKKYYGGGAMSARDAGRPRGAKSVEFDTYTKYIVPSWVAKLSDGKINLNSGIDFSQLDDEDDESHEFVLRKRNENKSKGIEIIPVLSDELISGVEIDNLPKGYYYKNVCISAGAFNDINAERSLSTINNGIQERLEKEKIAKNINNKISDMFLEFKNGANFYFCQVDPFSGKYLVTGNDAVRLIGHNYITALNKIETKDKFIELFLRLYENEKVKLAKEKEHLKNKYGDNAVELSDGRLIPIVNGSVTIPKWAAGHLIGSGGGNIKNYQKHIGRRINLITFDEKEPKKAGANWIYK